VMRGVLTPFAHPLFTSMTGIGLGIATNARSGFVRLLAPVAGYLVAVFLHACWNGSASYANGAALLPVYVTIMLPIFMFVLALVLYQRRREQRVIAAELPGMARAGWIAPSEVELLQSLAGRRGWLRAVRRRSGASVAKAVADYQASVTELAILRHRMARGSMGPHARDWHDELLVDVLASRARAVGAPDALHAAWGRRRPPPGWAPPPPDWTHEREQPRYPGPRAAPERPYPGTPPAPPPGVPVEPPDQRGDPPPPSYDQPAIPPPRRRPPWR